jgi:predicted ATPase
LAISNIPIEITLGKDEQLFASKNGSIPYSIAELSDGERNTLLLCADVLTVPSNYLIILDEPERHLHRSIISPLLTSLFQKRKDCIFVISTHDVSLPIDHDEASVLLLRGCQWNDSNKKIGMLT